MNKFLPITLLLLAVAVALTACGTRPETAAVKPVEQPVAVEKIGGQDEVSNKIYFSKLADNFSAKSYNGASRAYTANDLKAPKAIWDALTYLGVNYIGLLRGEITARHGAALNQKELQKTLGQTGWYKLNTAFNLMTALNDFEKKNIDYLQKMEKIDEEGPKDARQLAIILNLPKEELTTDEAIKVYLVTHNDSILNKVRNIKALNKRYNGISDTKVFNNISLLSKGDRVKADKIVFEVIDVISNVYMYKSGEEFIPGAPPDSGFSPSSFYYNKINDTIWIPLVINLTNWNLVRIRDDYYITNYYFKQKGLIYIYSNNVIIKTLYFSDGKEYLIKGGETAKIRDPKMFYDFSYYAVKMMVTNDRVYFYSDDGSVKQYGYSNSILYQLGSSSDSLFSYQKAPFELSKVELSINRNNILFSKNRSIFATITVDVYPTFRKDFLFNYGLTLNEGYLLLFYETSPGNGDAFLLRVINMANRD